MALASGAGGERFDRENARAPALPLGRESAVVLLSATPPNIHPPFLFQIAAEALVDLGVSWVILGHSERRSLLGESNDFVGEKVEHAIEAGLDVIACIGETLEQRESGTMNDVLAAQLAGVAGKLKNADADWDHIVIAYEPVWAIGTGVVATPEQAQDAHAFVRGWLAQNVSARVADSVRILYGGSVNDANAATLATKPDIDGFLVGGASLKGDAFATICRAKAAVAA